MRLCWKPPWPTHTVACGSATSAGSQWMPGTDSSPTSSVKRRSST